MTSIHPSAAPLSVLFVCTGNVCRSPYAERLVRLRLPRFRAASRGIFALEGHPMERQMAAELTARGGEPRGFRAQQVSARDLDADLILTMSRRQRAHLVEEFPAAARRTGLLGHVPELIEMTHARGSAAPFREQILSWTRMSLPRDRDVPDPYGRSGDVAGSSAALITKLIDQLVPLLDTGDVMR